MISLERLGLLAVGTVFGLCALVSPADALMQRTGSRSSRSSDIPDLRFTLFDLNDFGEPIIDGNNDPNRGFFLSAVSSFDNGLGSTGSGFFYLNNINFSDINGNVVTESAFSIGFDLGNLRSEAQLAEVVDGMTGDVTFERTGIVNYTFSSPNVTRSLSAFDSETDPSDTAYSGEVLQVSVDVGALGLDIEDSVNDLSFILNNEVIQFANFIPGSVSFAPGVTSFSNPPFEFDSFIVGQSNNSLTGFSISDQIGPVDDLVSGSGAAIPEPLTVVGSLSALGLGALLKRKHRA